MQHTATILEKKELSKINRKEDVVPAWGLIGEEYERSWNMLLEVGRKVSELWKTKKTGQELLLEERRI